MSEMSESLEAWLKELTDEMRQLAGQAARIEGTLEAHDLLEPGGVLTQGVPAAATAISASRNEKMTAGVVFSAMT